MRRPAIFLLLLGVIAGCAGPEPRTVDSRVSLPSQGLTELPQVAEVDLAEGGGVQLLLSEGWGQLRISARAAIRVQVEHESIDVTVPTNFTEDQYVVVRMDVWPDTHESDSQHFSWLGQAVGSSLPETKAPPVLGGAMELSSDTVLLTVATNVPGFIVQLGADATQQVEWRLRSHPGLQHALPAPSSSLGTDAALARVAYERSWKQDIDAAAPAAIYARAWMGDSSPGIPGLRWGISEARLAIHPSGEPPELSNSYGLDGGTGNYFGSSLQQVALVDPAMPTTATFVYSVTDAGTTATADGLAVLVLPLRPPAVEES